MRRFEEDYEDLLLRKCGHCGERWYTCNWRNKKCPKCGHSIAHCRHIKADKIREAILFWHPPWMKTMKEIASLLKQRGVSVSAKDVEWHHARMCKLYRRLNRQEPVQS